jgi:hypothetical protein
VKATAVWAELTANGLITSGNALPADADDPQLRQFFQTSSKGQFGMFLDPPTQALFSIGFEFKVHPPNIGSEPNVTFDLSRQMENKAWLRDTVSGWTPIPPQTFPANPDEPNDDSHSVDEDLTPRNDHIYSTDFINIPYLGPPADRIVKRGNFREFVRVRFDGAAFQNANGQVEGSRCSELIDWQMRGDILKNQGNWNYSIGGSNELKSGHTPLGNHP